MGALVFLGLSLRAYMKIRDGHGADAYDNVYGFHILWSQAAALLGSVALIGVCAYSVRWWQLWKRSREEGVSVGTIAKDMKERCMSLVAGGSPLTLVGGDRESR